MSEAQPFVPEGISEQGLPTLRNIATSEGPMHPQAETPIEKSNYDMKATIAPPGGMTMEDYYRQVQNDALAEVQRNSRSNESTVYVLPDGKTKIDVTFPETLKAVRALATDMQIQEAIQKSLVVDNPQPLRELKTPEGKSYLAEKAIELGVNREEIQDAVNIELRYQRNVKAESLTERYLNENMTMPGESVATLSNKIAQALGYQGIGYIPDEAITNMITDQANAAISGTRS